ncbi:NADH-quinone oxidoreductase subunit A [candidate division KSB1 bacterium]|nr:NADH-quinone oxidoreductase subunit A [candidate division KSB1 bacterium]
MSGPYLPVLLFFLFAFLFAAVILFLNALLGPKAKDRRDYASKFQPFECGSDPLDENTRRISVRFYLIALLFVLFDLEAILLFPWATVARSIGGAAYFVLFVFIFFLLLALVYAYQKKAFEWR